MMMYRQYIITGMNKMNAAELFAEKQTYLDQFHASGYPAAFEDYQSQVKAFFDACDSTCTEEEKNIEDFCKLNEDGRELLQKSVERYGFSPRAIASCLKVARTIADMEESDKNSPLM